MVRDDESLRRIFLQSRAIAIVGLSSQLDRASHPIAYYLRSLGYRIFPVNPNAEVDKIVGEKVYAALKDIPEAVDIVQVYRKRDDVPPVVEEAIEIGAKVVWMQLGIANPAAAKRAEEAGLQVVMNRCMLEEHLRLFGQKFVTW